MKSSSIVRRVRRAISKIEGLEQRQLLSATLVSPVPTQSASVGQSTTVSLGTYFNDPQVTGTAVLMQTPLGNIPIALAAATPLTDANFLQYISSGEYADTIIHRSVPGFVIQGGGYTPDGNHITQFAAVQGEPGISNTVGTIAMALSNGPDSGTSEWFINLGDNSQALDGTVDHGPFTVFGNVIYNGMSVVNAIAAEPIINGDAQSTTVTENGAWQTVPVVNYSGANPSTSAIPAANLITNDTTVVPALSYAVTSANPGLLTASVSNGSLTLTPAAGIASTTTNVTVTATDLGGGTTTSTFAVNITGIPGGIIPVTIDAGGAKSATYTDADGTVGTITLKGPGTATINFTGGGDSGLVVTTVKSGVAVSGPDAGINSIVTTGTNGSSALTVNTKGGTGAIDVGGLTTDGLKSITGKGVTLTGNVTSASSIGAISVAAVNGGSINVSAIGTLTTPGSFSDNIDLTGGGVSLSKFTAGSIVGGTWTVSGSIKAMTAGTISGWEPVVSGSIGSLTVNKGDLNGSLTAASVGSIKIKGNLNNASINLTGAGKDLASISVSQQITGSNIIAAGSIGNVSAAALTGSGIGAGLSTTLDINTTLPANAGDFATAQSIASVKLKTNASGNSYSDSAIAAQDIGRLSLGTVQNATGTSPTGVGAETIGSLTAVISGKHVNLKNVTVATPVTTILSGQGVTLEGFEVDVVT